MNSTQINCLLTLGDTGSITKTAQKLYLAQPTVSKNLKKLEAELGIKLIEVHGHKTEFTSQGEAFYQLMSDLNAKFKEGLNSIYAEPETQPIKICHSALPFEKAYLPVFVKMFENNFGRKIDLSIFFASQSYEDNIELFLQNKADFILIQEEFFHDDSRMGYEPLFKTGFSVIISKDNPLSHKRYLNFEDIANEKIWIWDSKNSLKSFQQIEKLLKKTNPDVSISKINSMSSCEMYAATNKGISIVPSFTYDNRNPNIVYNFLNCNVSVTYGTSFLKKTSNKPFFRDVIKYLKIAINSEMKKY